MWQVIANGLIVGSIYALVAVGFALIYSSVRFYHIAYGSIAVFGAYITHLLQATFHLPFFVSTFLAALAGGLLGWTIWMVLYRPLKAKHASNTVMLVASFGLLIILQNVTALIFGNATKSLLVTDEIIPGYSIGAVTITFNQIVIYLCSIVMVILFELLMSRTKLGLAMRAVGQSKELALAVGVRAEQVVQMAFFIGTFLAVIGTSLAGLELGLRPTYGLILVLKVIIACIVGGMGSVKGALAGGFILGISENLGIYFLGGMWQETSAFLLLVIFLLFKPKGLFSH